MSGKQVSFTASLCHPSENSESTRKCSKKIVLVSMAEQGLACVAGVERGGRREIRTLINRALVLRPSSLCSTKGYNARNVKVPKFATAVYLPLSILS